MSNNYFPGIGLFSILSGEPLPEPAPEPVPEPASDRDPNIIYAEPIGENPEIIALKRQIKILEDKVKTLTQENINLKQMSEKMKTKLSIIQNNTKNIGITDKDRENRSTAIKGVYF
tara:strand:- start:159 stop:506 length:348 start_codon:yes stop_codon:yes gene_type:complete